MRTSDQADPLRAPRLTLVRTRILEVVLLGMLLGSAIFVRDIYFTLGGTRIFDRAMAEHFAATVGVPLMASASLALVILLQVAAGPIEFDALGFKFKGAAGPLVMWLLCFLALVSAVKLLW